MKVVITVEDYGQIRRRYLRGESQRQIARDLHISRNTVAKYCEGAAVPWVRKTPERTAQVLKPEIVAFIQACLDEDEAQGLRKQKHTAKRIYDRLVSDCGFTGGESTVRAKVQELRQKPGPAFVPLAFSPGEAMQVDWGEAVVYIAGEKLTVNLFCARLCSSCAPVVLAYRHQNEESFLDAFVRTFAAFGGVPEKVIFDNGKVAVKDGFGAKAQKQAGYTALCAHYGFEALFCNPAEGHEKGLVEGLVGWARRNILVPVPQADSFAALNSLLAERCHDYESHHIPGKPATVGEMLAAEKAALRPLPVYPFETAKCRSVRVSAFSTARFATNDYSVPCAYAGRKVGVKVYPEKVELYFGGQQIASHERCFGKHQTVYELEHYLPLLEQRGRAILNAAPVRQNVSAQVMDELRKAGSHQAMLEILRRCAGQAAQQAAPVIQDQVIVQHVDLRVYDGLSTGKAVHSVGC